MTALFILMSVATVSFGEAPSIEAAPREPSAVSWVERKKALLVTMQDAKDAEAFTMSFFKVGGIGLGSAVAVTGIVWLGSYLFAGLHWAVSLEAWVIFLGSVTLVAMVSGVLLLVGLLSLPAMLHTADLAKGAAKELERGDPRPIEPKAPVTPRPVEPVGAMLIKVPL